MKQINKKIILFLLIVAILTLGIVFATRSTTLNIRGSGLVNGGNWSIKFENLENVSLTGTAQETTKPVIKSDTEIGDYSVVLKKPGDKVTYNFDVHNYGSIDAQIELLNISDPLCIGTATDEQQKINLYIKIYRWNMLTSR